MTSTRYVRLAGFSLTMAQARLARQAAHSWPACRNAPPKLHRTVDVLVSLGLVRRTEGAGFVATDHLRAALPSGYPAPVAPPQAPLAPPAVPPWSRHQDVELLLNGRLVVARVAGLYGRHVLLELQDRLELLAVTEQELATGRVVVQDLPAPSPEDLVRAAELGAQVTQELEADRAERLRELDALEGNHDGSTT